MNYNCNSQPRWHSVTTIAQRARCVSLSNFYYQESRHSYYRWLIFCVINPYPIVLWKTSMLYKCHLSNSRPLFPLSQFYSLAPKLQQQTPPQTACTPYHKSSPAAQRLRSHAVATPSHRPAAKRNELAAYQSPPHHSKPYIQMILDGSAVSKCSAASLWAPTSSGSPERIIPPRRPYVRVKRLP